MTILRADYGMTVAYYSIGVDCFALCTAFQSIAALFVRDNIGHISRALQTTCAAFYIDGKGRRTYVRRSVTCLILHLIELRRPGDQRFEGHNT